MGGDGWVGCDGCVGVAQRAQPGVSSSGSARRMDSDDSRGTWSNQDTLPLGAGSACLRPPAVEQSSSGRSTARAAGQQPQRSGPAGPARGSGSGSARQLDSDDSRGTWSNGDPSHYGAGNASRRPPAVGRSSSGRSTARVAGQRHQRSGPAGPARRQWLLLSPANGQRRQSGYVVERGHPPSWGRQCSSTTTRSGAGRQRRRNGGGGGAAAQAQWPCGPSPEAAAPAQLCKWTATTVGVRGRTETFPSWGRSTTTRSGAGLQRRRNG